MYFEVSIMAPFISSLSTSTAVKDMKLDDSTRKSSLVQGELADLEAIRKEKSNRGGALHHRANLCWDDFHYSLKLLRQNPRILIISFIVFAILCGGSLGLVFYLANNEDEQDKGMALDLAVETGRWFCKYNGLRLSVNNCHS